ncbi:MAG: NAD-binding protein [Acidobacteria bacterium]|nr:NAD-binding protein [Acidobacteriota bacterium]
MKTEPSERPSPGRARHPAPRRPPDRSGTYVRAVAVVFLVVSLLTVGTVGFHLIEGWSYFKALYGTLMTVSTIGAEPENQLSETGQIFNVTLVFLGVGVVGFAMATLTHAVIESELGTFFGRRRMEKEISRLKDHIIICGAGRVGRRVASEVAARDIPLVIVEQDAVKARWAQEQTFLVIIGDATSEAVLRQARIEHARGLASAVTSDAQNVYIIRGKDGRLNFNPRPDQTISSGDFLIAIGDSKELKRLESMAGI